jgi:CHAT domain-containing protein/tetratricopeptide (TPR) repeat protein
MKSVAVTLALVAACACAISPPTDLRALAEQTRQALLRGELAEAQRYIDQGHSRSTSQNDLASEWTFRLLRAEALLAARDLDGLRSLLGADPPSELTALRGRQRYLQARLHQETGELPRALELLEEARPLAARDTELLLDIDVQDGQIRLRRREWADGESRLRAVASRAAAEGLPYYEAVAYHNLGTGRLVRNRFDEALPWFERTLAFTGLEPLTVYAAALTNAGICYSRLGQFDRAVATGQRAVDIHERGGRRQFLEQALGSLGITHGLRGDPRSGLPYLQRALAVAVESNLTADAALWAGNLAGIHIGLEQWDDGERFNEQSRALKLASKSGRIEHNLLNSAEIAAGRGRLDDAARLFEEALAAASDGAPSVHWTARAGLARVALAARQPERAFQHFEAALTIVEKTRSDLLQTDYRLSFLTRLITLYQDYVDALVSAGRSDRALEIVESSRGRVLAEHHGVSPPLSARAPSFVRAAGRSQSVLLSYWLAPKRSFVWSVTRGGIRRTDLPPAGEIAALVEAHRAAIDNALADPLAARDTPGDALYRLLVQPVAPLIGNGARVVIAADGALHGLSFETLPVGEEARRYFIEDAEVQMTPSLALLDRPPADGAPDASLLLIGNALPIEPEFPALRFAAAEMQGVARPFPADRVTMFDRGAASPSAFHDAGPGRFRYIHFTAHATANPESPLDSAVILSESGATPKLYARDVANAALQAELVTVSACRSAGERAYSGEGLVGFAWAFLRAGAKRVVAGLWDVDDQSTASLMEALYQRLAAGDRPARALREAKLTLLRQGGRTARPYYWAPLQLFTVSL